LFGNGLNDFWMRVAENQRAPRANVIDVFVSIGVPQARPGCSLNDDGIAAHGAKRAHGTVHAAYQYVNRAAKYFFRMWP
jgi:hypothetical protein